MLRFYRNVKGNAGISRAKGTFYVRRAFHKSRKGFISLKKSVACAMLFFGPSCGTRTHGPQNRNLILYPTELKTEIYELKMESWEAEKENDVQRVWLCLHSNLVFMGNGFLEREHHRAHGGTTFRVRTRLLIPISFSVVFAPARRRCAESPFGRTAESHFASARLLI